MDSIAESRFVSCLELLQRLIDAAKTNLDHSVFIRRQIDC